MTSKALSGFYGLSDSEEEGPDATIFFSKNNKAPVSANRRQETNSRPRTEENFKPPLSLAKNPPSSRETVKKPNKKSRVNNSKSVLKNYVSEPTKFAAKPKSSSGSKNADDKKKSEADLRAEQMVSEHIRESHKQTYGGGHERYMAERARQGNADPGRPKVTRKVSTGTVGRSSFASMAQSVRAPRKEGREGWAGVRTFGSVARASRAMMKVATHLAEEERQHDHEEKPPVSEIKPVMKAGFLQLLDNMSAENERKAKEAKNKAKELTAPVKRTAAVSRFYGLSDDEDDEAAPSAALAQFYGEC